MEQLNIVKIVRFNHNSAIEKPVIDRFQIMLYSIKHYLAEANLKLKFKSSK